MASAAGGARADRCVRRRAGAGPRAGDRHLPLRLDPGLRTVALDARQAGAARGRGDRRRRGAQRAVLLVLPAVHRRGQPGPVSPLPVVFDLRGIAFAAWTLVAFAIGALAGMLIRRVVPAIVATLAAYAGLALAAGVFLRQHYLTPLVTSNLNVPGSAWITSQWWTKGGTFAFGGRPPDRLLQFCPPSASAPDSGRTRQAVAGNPRAVPRPARLHAVDQVPAGQPVLAIPVDRGRLAARAVGTAHRRDGLAGPPPRGLRSHRPLCQRRGLCHVSRQNRQPAGGWVAVLYRLFGEHVTRETSWNT